MSKKKVKPYAAVFPCPVALVSVTLDDTPNLITLAWVANVCSDPPKVGISIRPSRYSHQLIKNSGEFVVNIPAEELLKEVDFCGVVSGRDHNKFEEAKLTPLPASSVKSPLVKECPVNIECKLEQVISLGTHDLFIGEVLVVWVDGNLLNEKNYPDYSKIKPISYLPPADYFSLQEKIGFYGFSRGEPI